MISHLLLSSDGKYCRKWLKLRKKGNKAEAMGSTFSTSFHISSQDLFFDLSKFPANFIFLHFPGTVELGDKELFGHPKIVP